MKNLSNIIFIILIFLLTSCTKINTQIKPQNLRLGDGSGIILTSLTMDYSLKNDAWFYYKKLGENKEKRMEAVGVIMFSAPDEFPENKKKLGRLMAYKVSPGKYLLTKWTLYAFTISPTYIYPTHIEPIEFEVKPNQITYIGNLDLSTIYGKNIFGVKIPISAIASIKDKRYRDMKIFKKKFPELQNLHINYSVNERNNWGSGIKREF